MKTARVVTPFGILFALAAAVALVSVPLPAAGMERTNVVHPDADEGGTMPASVPIGPQLPPPLRLPGGQVPGVEVFPPERSVPELHAPPAPPIPELRRHEEPPPSLQRARDGNGDPVPATERLAGGWSGTIIRRPTLDNPGYSSYTLPDAAVYGGRLESPSDALPPPLPQVHLPVFSVDHPDLRGTDGRPLNFLEEGGTAASLGGKINKALRKNEFDAAAPGAVSDTFWLIKWYNRFARIWNAGVDRGYGAMADTAARELGRWYVNDRVSKYLASRGAQWVGTTLVGSTPQGIGAYLLLMLAGYAANEAVSTCVNNAELIRDTLRPHVRRFVQGGMQWVDGTGRAIRNRFGSTPAANLRGVTGAGGPIHGPTGSSRPGGGCAAGCPPSN